MGRRPDDPIEQAAKGFPGRRRKKVMAAAEAAAQLIADETRGDTIGLPQMFADAPARWRRAIQIWNVQAETLRRVGRMQPAFRLALARYCIWTQVFEFAANQLGRDCPKGDYIIDYKTGHGAEKKTQHPALAIMHDAEPILRLLDHEFGFTPRSDADQKRVETFNAAQGRLPLGDVAQRTADATNMPVEDPMDLMNVFDTPGPHGAN